jgi:sodium transport system permease protein
MWTVFKKEILEMLRERRTLLFTFLLPTVVIPVLIGGFGVLAGYKTGQEADRVLKYAVVGAEHAPGLYARLLAVPKLERVALAPGASVDDAVRSGSVSLGLIIPAGFEQAMAEGRSMTLELHYNDAVTVDTVARRMRLLTTSYGAEVRQRYLAAHAIGDAAQHFVAEPVSLEIKSTANARQRTGELVGAFLPYIFLMMGFTASMSAALDMGAGEKERGTLESLLLLPLPRSHLVLAKFFAIALLGIVAGLVSVVSLAVWGLGLFKGAGGAIEQMLQGAGAYDIALVGLMILPANAIVAALLLAVSFYARSYREAGQYASVMLLLLLGPILIALLPNMQLHSGWAWVPITNIALAVKEIVKGTLMPGDFAVVFVSTTLVAGSLLWFCTVWCKRESVLFR